MRYDPEAALRALSAHTGDRPFVIGQLGQSLDGRIATPTGKSKYISGRGALEHLHRLRAHVDAVVVGINTVLADDPQLTVRMVEGRSPARVIIDPKGRLPHSPRCLHDGATGRILVVRSKAHAYANGLSGKIDILPISCDGSGNLPAKDIIAALHARGLSKILIEGGAQTLARCLSAGIVDALHVMVAPVILGSGQPGFALPPIDDLDEGLHPRSEVFTFPDGDVLFCCNLREKRVSIAQDSTMQRTAKRRTLSDPVVRRLS
ncbi:MAG: RibD family protein [Neomegalonema sp.]|nr:RibD family protein [Neomegalonema sp.]